MAERIASDDDLAPDGRVMEMLSEHQCQGWLEGYLLTSHVWRQDHNGFSHQDPGFIDPPSDSIRSFLGIDLRSIHPSSQPRPQCNDVTP